jgi:hypothetical protein
MFESVNKKLLIHLFYQGYGFTKLASRPLKEAQPLATVDHADIRGLVTARLVFVAELPLSMCGSFAFP